MAVLSDSDRFDVWAAFMREPEAGDVYGITKTDLRAAVNAIDTWIDDNASAFNSAIPQPARGSMTTRQKARLLNYVVRQRYIRS